MIHESWNTNGFCYRRFNRNLKGLEYMGYAGFFCAHTDNPSYYKRTMIKNT